MDIGSGTGYPSAALPNFAMQKHVCTLVGKKAKFKGKKTRW